MRLAYLYSRYPVISQTFCDMEMLALERLGFSIEIGSIHPPLTSLRHEHAARLQAPIYYAPPQHTLRIREKQAKANGSWPAELVEQHEQKYGKPFKAALRARNALYFADLFPRHHIEHCHVHFANRAAHTALFLKKMSGITFSVSAHGQDFMVDLGNDELLREIFREAEFIAAETDYSMKLLQERCPESADKIHRVYNGMDLASISSSRRERPSGPTTILSVGRLVPFKGFEVLIEACAELDQRNFAFHCEIVGDGPLREKLESAILHHRLGKRVQLCGSLSQENVFSKLQDCDIFALASVMDQNGASDVFPTVIQEAMALARPVVSTRLAGIPESVIDGVTGLLVPPGDSQAFADALDKLMRNSAMRSSFGAAARNRIEKHFQIETTVAPLRALLEKCASPIRADKTPDVASETPRIAYLIAEWPDQRLPFLEMELRAMDQNQVALAAIVFQSPEEPKLTPKQEGLVTKLEFLPDAMVVEAEWQSNRALARELEAERANQEHRPFSQLFLEQARFALALRKMLLERKINHVHATSSRVLLCALMLRKLLGVTVSAAIEHEPVLSQKHLQSALDQCVGGRSNNRELLARRSTFLFDTALETPSVNEIGRWLKKKATIDWTGGAAFWKEWSQLL
ncbi:MAG: glycosyltransferase family 4 protein, partial [Verrucomicrobiota bacterium]